MNETINNKISSKPLVILTRKLPEIIETRMRELFDARLNENDTPDNRATNMKNEGSNYIFKTLHKLD